VKPGGRDWWRGLSTHQKVLSVAVGAAVVVGSITISVKAVMSIGRSPAEVGNNRPAATDAPSAETPTSDYPDVLATPQTTPSPGTESAPEKGVVFTPEERSSIAALFGPGWTIATEEGSVTASCKQGIFIGESWKVTVLPDGSVEVDHGVPSGTHYVAGLPSVPAAIHYVSPAYESDGLCG